jgi:hypothetical protein
MGLSQSDRRILAVLGIVGGVALAGLVGLAVAARWLRHQSQEEAKAGGIYSVVAQAGQGQYGLLKVLKVEPSAIHVRLYKGRWPQRPENIDPASLRVGSLSDADAGIGHLPLSRRVFRAWRPRLILVTEVGPEELDGYEEWKKAGGSVWDR